MNINTFLSVAIWGICGTIIVSGCYTERTAQRQVNRAQAQYSDVVAGYCGLWYPPLTYTERDSVYLPGQIIPGKTSYITVDCDSAVAMANTTGKTGTTRQKAMVAVPCKCDSITAALIKVNVRSNQENTGKVTAMARKLEDSNESLIKLTASRNTWRKVALVTSGLLILVAGIWALKTFVKTKL